MSILIKSTTILNKASVHHGKVRDVLIEKGIIQKIGTRIDEKVRETIDGKGAYLSIGWFDMRANFNDPGLEHKEDLYSGAETAAAGGFTGVAILPNNKPTTQTKNDVGYIRSFSSDLPVKLYPIAAVTENAEGSVLTEMIDLHTAGAVAFSDGERPLWNTDILLKTLQYLQKFKGVLIDKPEDKQLTRAGVMNEGIHSTILGMKGMPALSEYLAVQRNVEVLKYTGGKLHLTCISAEESIKLLKEAKKEGLSISADMAVYQTAFNDGDLNDFDTNYKVNPPYRTAKNNKTLVKALKEGIIDVLVSNHSPQDEECKKLEYDLADFGIISLQSFAHHIAELAQHIELENLIDTFTTNPRKVLGLAVPEIKEGVEAELTLFSTERKWRLDGKSSKSKSTNSPFWEKELTGEALATIKGQSLYQNQ